MLNHSDLTLFDLHEYILMFSEGNMPLVNIIHQIIKQERIVEYDILNMFKDIYEILKRTSKYMDILGYSRYMFITKTSGINNIGIRIEYLFRDDTQLIYLIFPDLDKLCYYIDKYLNFNKMNSTIYMIRNYNVKQFLKQK